MPPGLHVTGSGADSVPRYLCLEILDECVSDGPRMIVDGVMHVLIAMEEDYRIYRAVMAGGLHAMRPHLQVATAGLQDFEERLRDFEPQIVICGGKVFVRSEGPLVWMDLAFDSEALVQRPARIYIGDRCREVTNPDLDYLLSVIDEVDPG